jgi:hypothetical protein
MGRETRRMWIEDRGVNRGGYFFYRRTYPTNVARAKV